MRIPEKYWTFIEKCRTEVQIPPLELHHIRSKHGYPDLEHDVTNHLWLNRDNHDYATLLQCWEEDYPLLCPWQGNRIKRLRPNLEKEVTFWLSKKGTVNSVHIRNIDNSHVLTPEVCSKAGSLSWGSKSPEQQLEHMQKMRERIDHETRVKKLVQQPNFMGRMPWWHRLVNGEIERKRSLTKPEGEGWESGKGDSYPRKRVRCTITGHEGTQSSLARWQKNRGIDPSNREFIGDQS